MSKNCPLCKHPTQAQIEAQFIQGTMSVVDIVERLDGEDIDADEELILMHFNTHETVIDKAVREKQKVDRTAPRVTTEDVLGEVDPNEDDFEGEDALALLIYMLDQLRNKFDSTLLQKGSPNISHLTREIRETLKEIERVRKVQKHSQVDRAKELRDEHRSMNKWLLYNLCKTDLAKYQAFLRGEEEVISDIVRKARQTG